MLSPKCKVKATNFDFDSKYRTIGLIGSGAFSVVTKCQELKSSKFVACKQLDRHYALRSQALKMPELSALLRMASHPNVIRLLDWHFERRFGVVSLLFELWEKNLHEYIVDRDGKELPENRAKDMLTQLLEGVNHLHKFGVFHRDIKPENVFVRSGVDRDLVVLGDLGTIQTMSVEPPYTQYISTRWYRSPECLLTAGYYGSGTDIWATGCIFFEMLTLTPLFPGNSESHQIALIHATLGKPKDSTLRAFYKLCDEPPKHQRNSNNTKRVNAIKSTLGNIRNDKNKRYAWFSAPKEVNRMDVLVSGTSIDCQNFLKLMLTYDPEERPSAEELLQHDFLKRNTGYLRERLARNSTESELSLIGLSLPPTPSFVFPWSNIAPVTTDTAERFPRINIASPGAAAMPGVISLPCISSPMFSSKFRHTSLKTTGLLDEASNSSIPPSFQGPQSANISTEPSKHLVAGNLSDKNTVPANLSKCMKNKNSGRGTYRPSNPSKEDLSANCTPSYRLAFWRRLYAEHRGRMNDPASKNVVVVKSFKEWCSLSTDLPHRAAKSKPSRSLSGPRENTRRNAPLSGSSGKVGGVTKSGASAFGKKAIGNTTRVSSTAQESIRVNTAATGSSGKGSTKNAPSGLTRKSSGSTQLRPGWDSTVSNLQVRDSLQELINKLECRLKYGGKPMSGRTTPRAPSPFSLSPYANIRDRLNTMMSISKGQLNAALPQRRVKARSIFHMRPCQLARPQQHLAGPFESYNFPEGE